MGSRNVATNASLHLCAFRRSEVPCLQLRIWHQMGVQQALEEQAWPEVGGKRRRAQVGGNCVEYGTDLDISKYKCRPDEPRGRLWSSEHRGFWQGTWEPFSKHVSGRRV